MAVVRSGLVRQGDVLLVPLEGDVPAGVVIEPKAGRLVLAEGEATGHAHVVRARNARLVRHGRPTGRRGWMGRPEHEYRLLLVVEGEPVVLEHEEHDPIPVGPGMYEVRRQREYTPAVSAPSASRLVRD